MLKFHFISQYFSSGTLQTQMEKIFSYARPFFCILFLLFGADEAKAQTLTKYIVVDQFGYLPTSKKIAVIRDPQVGFDASESFTPGTQYALIDKTTGQSVFTAAPGSWKAGATDNSSGDKAWWFDVSAIND